MSFHLVRKAGKIAVLQEVIADLAACCQRTERDPAGEPRAGLQNYHFVVVRLGHRPAGKQQVLDFALAGHAHKVEKVPGCLEPGLGRNKIRQTLGAAAHLEHELHHLDCDNAPSWQGWM